MKSGGKRSGFRSPIIQDPARSVRLCEPAQDPSSVSKDKRRSSKENRRLSYPAPATHHFRVRRPDVPRRAGTRGSLYQERHGDARKDRDRDRDREGETDVGQQRNPTGTARRIGGDRDRKTAAGEIRYARGIPSAVHRTLSSPCSTALARVIRDDCVLAHKPLRERWLRTRRFRHGAHAPCSRLTRASS